MWETIELKEAICDHCGANIKYSDEDTHWIYGVYPKHICNTQHLKCPKCNKEFVVSIESEKRVPRL